MANLVNSKLSANIEKVGSDDVGLAVKLFAMLV